MSIEKPGPSDISPNEKPPDLETEGVEEKTLESIEGFLPELLRITFNRAQLQIFQSEILEQQGLTLDALSEVSDQTAKEATRLFSAYVEARDDFLDDPKERGLGAAQIADIIRGK